MEKPNIIELTAVERNIDPKRLENIRKEDLVPAVVYGPGRGRKPPLQRTTGCPRKKFSVSRTCSSSSSCLRVESILMPY